MDADTDNVDYHTSALIVPLSLRDLRLRDRGYG